MTLPSVWLKITATPAGFQIIIIFISLPHNSLACGPARPTSSSAEIMRLFMGSARLSRQNYTAMAVARLLMPTSATGVISASRRSDGWPIGQPDQERDDFEPLTSSLG